jgi:hypothetical protein
LKQNFKLEHDVWNCFYPLTTSDLCIKSVDWCVKLVPIISGGSFNAVAYTSFNSNTFTLWSFSITIFSEKSTID